MSRSDGRSDSNGASDYWVVISCLAVGAACYLHPYVPMLLLIIAGTTALVTRRRWIVTIALVFLASALSSNAWAMLDKPYPETVDGVATVIQDPQTVNHATRAEVRFQGRHYLVWAYGSAAYNLADVAAGNHVEIRGTTGSLTGVSAPSYRRRHIVADVNATSLTFVDSGPVPARIANGVRGVIARGAAWMPSQERALLTGFVYGDDRGQSVTTKNDFQASGLSHLLAVSGENVAFVLLLMAPLLKRFSIWGRLVGGLGVLVLFGVVTRWEPSVVRAEMMAAVALVAVFLGRPISTWRCLGLGSMVAMLCDPFLAGSVGFLLSVSACFGMALLGRPITDHLRGPMWVRRALAYSGAAQLGVAPVQIAVFNSLPVVSLLTNVAAEPIAGFVMIWGVVAGLIAGAIPVAGVRILLHIPDLIALTVVRYIAHFGTSLEATSWGKAAGVLGSVLLVVVFWAPPGTANLDSRAGTSSSFRLPDQRRRSGVGERGAELTGGSARR
jgi:competence protein ComEC